MYTGHHKVPGIGLHGQMPPVTGDNQIGRVRIQDMSRCLA